MPKKTLSVLLSVLMCLTMLPMKISAEDMPEEILEAKEKETNDYNNEESSGTEQIEETNDLLFGTYGDLTYSISDGKVTITDCNESVTSVDIPSEIEGHPVEGVDYEAFYNCSSLISITIPNSVRYIGGYAFENCTSLTSITLPDSLTSISNGLFASCSSLTSITIPNSVTSIGSNAFTHCSSLISITIPYGVTKIEYYAFDCCTCLSDITLPESVTSIGSTVFSNCISLTSIEIPDSITRIPYGLFWNCTNLTNIIIPDSVTSIGANAFNYCEKLSSITIPDSVTNIDSCAFENCTSLTNITLPDNLTSISNNLFASCSSLTSITIPGSVTNIGESAFNECGIQKMYFKGNYPDNFASNAFSSNMSFTVYYPENNSTWTSDKLQNYGAGSIIWKTWDAGSGNGDDTSNPFFIIGKNTNTFKHDEVNEAGEKYWELLLGSGSGYPMSERHYRSLLAMCEEQSDRDHLIQRMNREWGGSCFGLTSTIVLAFLNKMSLTGYKSLSGKSIPENYSDLASPVDDVNLLSTINYYYVLQYFDFPEKKHIIERSYNPSKEEFLSFWRDMYFSAKRACSNKNPLGFAYGVEYTDVGSIGGHIVLIANCSETKEKYVFYLYDCNDIKHFKILNVDKTSGELHWLRYYSIGGYQEILSTQWDDKWLFFWCIDFSEWNPDHSESNNTSSLRTISDEPGTELFITSGKTMRIKNDKGDYLEYKEGLFSGNMEIIDQDYICDTAELMVRVPSSDFFVVDQIEGTMGLDIVDGEANKFYSIEETGADKVYFHIDKGIGLAGDDVDYTAYFGTEEDDPSVIKLSGNSTADISFIQKENEISVQSEENAAEVSISVLSKEGIEEKGTEIVNEDQIIDSQGNVEEAPEGTVISLHDFDDPKFVWCEDTCTASVTCKDDGYIEEYACEITEGTIDGEETLTATVTINGKEYSTTKKKNEGIHLNKKELVLRVEQSETLVPTIHPEGMELIWSSSDESVATVDQNGKVTAAADNGIGTPSTAVITVSANDGSYIAKCTVTVEDPINGFVRRLYKLCFNRTADPGGFNKWTGELRSKKNTAAATVKFFFTSKEFNNLQLDNEAFVEMCYKVMMDRASDAGGKKNWLDKLDAGVSQAYVLKGFIGSREFANICMDYGIERGTIKLTEARDQNLGITQFVSRNYSEVLGRKADVGGLNNWCNKILTASDKKKAAINMASTGFFHSREYLNKDTANDEYVMTLYRTFLGREADKGGYNDWMSRLYSGTSRDSVLMGFANSAEFANIMAKYGIK